MRMKNKLACGCSNEIQAITSNERDVALCKACRTILTLNVNLNHKHCITTVAGNN
jgi:hypothetical protein